MPAGCVQICRSHHPPPLGRQLLEKVWGRLFRIATELFPFNGDTSWDSSVFSLKLKKGCGTGLVMDRLERLSSECLHVIYSSGSPDGEWLWKGKYFSREGIGKWQNSLVEDAVEARSTERLRKRNKRTRPAAGVEHNGVNTDFFSSRSPWTLYCLGSVLGKGLLCICHGSFNFSLSKSLKRQVMGRSSSLYCSC